MGKRWKIPYGLWALNALRGAPFGLCSNGLNYFIGFCFQRLRYYQPICIFIYSMIGAYQLTT
jgi:hypothetical protein